jgi:hypothetical protein
VASISWDDAPHRATCFLILCGLRPISAPAAFATPATAQAWQRVVCIDDPRLTVTLLRPSAKPADEEFVGFELDNKTAATLRVGNALRCSVWAHRDRARAIRFSGPLPRRCG